MPYPRELKTMLGLKRIRINEPAKSSPRDKPCAGIYVWVLAKIAYPGINKLLYIYKQY